MTLCSVYDLQEHRNDHRFSLAPSLLGSAFFVFFLLSCFFLLLLRVFYVFICLFPSFGS